MKTTYEKKILDKGWLLYLPSFKGVTVYIKTTTLGRGKFKQPLMNVGLLKDNYWYNYVYFAGDKDYLEEKTDHFLVEYKMKQDWDKHIKR